MALPGTNPFLLGVNYPWLDYAEDFGSGPRGHLGASSTEKKSRIAFDFERMQECGVKLVRWFLLGDGRGGFVTENGIPRRPDDFLLPDIATALELAQKCELKLCFSLFDYLWLQDRELPETAGQHERVLQFAAGRSALLENVFIPIFGEFRTHPAIFAWEVANEPEWAIREFHPEPSAKMHLPEFRAFATEIVQAIHEFAGAPATIGSARLMWVRAWSQLNLDFYQAHYYPSGERDGNADLQTQLHALRSLDKPLWLGELPARDISAPGYSLSSALAQCRDAGLCGAAVWRWTKPEAGGTDSSIGVVEPAELHNWLASNPSQTRV
jgi:hypothetical protein